MTHHTHITPAAPGDRPAAQPGSAQPGSDPSGSDPSGSDPSGPLPSDHWTSAKMAAFLRQLSASHSVSAAARSVGMSRQSAYRLRSRLKGKAFDVAWDVAFHHSYDNLAHAALERALNGVEMPVFFQGEQVGSYRKFDERLTVALLAMSTPGNVPVLARNASDAEWHAPRFEALVDAVERGGEEAEAMLPEDAPPGEISRLRSTNLSPCSEAEILAELRAMEGGDGG